MKYLRSRIVFLGRKDEKGTDNRFRRDDIPIRILYIESSK